MRWRRATASSIAFLALVAVTGCGAPVESGLVGAWVALVPTPTGLLTATCVIDDDGGYVTTFVGFPPLAPETGRLEAEDGRYRTETDAGATDEGTYVLSTPNTWVTTSARGTIVWQRAGTLPAVDPATASPPGWPAAMPAAMPPPPAPLENEWPLEGVPEIAKTVLQTARQWRADAILRGVSAELVASQGGVVGNVRTPAGMAKLTFEACSPSAGSRRSFAPGGFDLPEQPTSDCDAQRPLPDFPDFPAAVAQAQARGMTTDRPHSIAIEDFRNRGVPGEDLTDWAWRIVPPLQSRDAVQVFALETKAEEVRVVDACAVVTETDAEQQMGVDLVPGTAAFTTGNRTWTCAYTSPGSNAAGVRIQIDESPFRDKRGVLENAARNGQTRVEGLGDEAYFQLPGSGVASLTILLGDTLVELGLWGGKDPRAAIDALGHLAVERIVGGAAVTTRAGLADQLVGSWTTRLYDRRLLLTVRPDRSVNLQVAGEVTGVVNTVDDRLVLLSRARRPLLEGTFEVPRPGRLVTAGALAAQWHRTSAPVQIPRELVPAGALADDAGDTGPWPDVDVDARVVGLWEGVGSMAGQDARLLWRIRESGPSQLVWALAGNGYLEAPRATEDRVIVRLSDELRRAARTIGSDLDAEMIVDGLGSPTEFVVRSWSGARGDTAWRRLP